MRNFFLFTLIFFFFLNCKKSEENTFDNEAIASDIVSENSDSKVYENINAVSLPKVDQVKFVKPKVKNSDETHNITTEHKIIRTAYLKFETDDLNSTYNQMILAITKNHAIIQSETEGKDYGSIFKKIMVRIPSQNFNIFVKDISKGVSYFDNKDISTQDVTEEYIDIDARLKTKKILEARYIELLKKTNKVSEVLEIEKQLSIIREEIEAKEGQLRYIQSQVAMSTIDIEFYKTIANEAGATVSFGSKISKAIVSGFNSISILLVELLSIWPFLIILAVAIYFFRKKLRNKNKIK